MSKLPNPPEPQITICVPREFSDERVTDMRSWAADMQAVFGVPVFVQRPYGVTYQRWDAQVPESEAQP